MGIFLKRSTTGGAIPNANQLEYGELAINAADGKLYTKTTGGIITQLGNVIQSPTLPIGSITSAATNIFQPPDYLPCTGFDVGSETQQGMSRFCHLVKPQKVG